VEDVDETAGGKSFALVQHIGRYKHNGSGFEFPDLTVQIELEPALDQVNDLLMMMRMIGYFGPFINPPISKGHVGGMYKLYMVTGYQFLLFLLV
jgi:hypothetical protein